MLLIAGWVGWYLHARVNDKIVLMSAMRIPHYLKLMKESDFIFRQEEKLFSSLIPLSSGQEIALSEWKPGDAFLIALREAPFVHKKPGESLFPKQNFVLEFINAKLSPQGAFLYNPAFYTDKNPLQ